MEELDVLQLGRRSMQGIIALISRQFVLQIISIAAFLIISSVLLPSDIGIFTAVMAMQRIVGFFTDFGLGAALIQKKEKLTQGDLKTSFTIQAGITLIIFIFVLLTANFISGYFELSEQGRGLLIGLVFVIFISSFKTIPSILLERKIQFQKLVIPQIVESLVFNVLLVILVLNGFRVSSYTYAFLVSALVGLPIYYLISPWKLEIGIDRLSLKHLAYGVQFQAKNVLATIKDDLLTVILVKFLTFSQIGYIGFAQRISFLSYRYIVDSVTKVTFSSYSRLQEDKELMRKAIEKSLFYIGSIMFPLIAGTIIIVPYVIDYFPKWNNKWEPAVVSILFFSLNAGVSSLSAILVNALDATGRVKTTLRLMILWTSLTWILTPIFIIYFGFNGVAIASFMITLTIVYTIYLVRGFIKFDFVGSIAKPFSVTIIMAVVVYILSIFLVNDTVSLILVIACGGLVYFGLYYMIAKKELATLKNIIFKKYA